MHSSLNRYVSNFYEPVSNLNFLHASLKSTNIIIKPTKILFLLVIKKKMLLHNLFDSLTSPYSYCNTYLLFYPRQPTLYYNQPTFISSNSSFPIFPFTASINLSIEASVFSPNYIDWNFRWIAISGYVPTETTEQISISSRYTNLKIKAHENTSFVVPFLVEYKSLNTSLILFKEIVRNCVGKGIEVKFIVQGYFDLISWVGYIPEYSNVKNIPCLFSPELVKIV